MNIGIIDADLLDNGTRHPNLALMKISGYHKGLGHNIKLIEGYKTLDNKDYDVIYMSRVFTFTRYDEVILKFNNIIIGGTGFFEDGGEDLSEEVEHHFPDYHLYDEYIEKEILNGKARTYYKDYLNYSIGFATRGCFRKCDFCVNKKYDRVHFHSHISEWFDSTRKGIYLWDDNIFAYENWRDIFDELDKTGKPFQFRQGLDVRLLTVEKAKRLSQSKYNGDIIFAFDHIEDKDIIEKKLSLWREHCKKGTKIYVLCAFDSLDEKDIKSTFERIEIIIKYGCLPYIMRYESYKNSKYRSIYVQLARWCNQPQFLKKKSFRQFCEANQLYHKNKNTLCSALAAMIEFEQEHPEIAKMYFDIRYDEQEYVIKRKNNGA